jgi:hypothetical protein
VITDDSGGVLPGVTVSRRRRGGRLKRLGLPSPEVALRIVVGNRIADERELREILQPPRA